MVGIGLLILWFGDGIEHRLLRVVGHMLEALAVLEIVRAGERAGRERRMLFVARVLYAVPVLALAWDELNLVVPILYDGSYWMTDVIIHVDQWIAGGHPTVLVQTLHRPWLDEVMASLYTGYYLFPTVPIVLLVLRRDQEALAAASVIAITYCSNFALFLLLPAKSPPQILSEYAGLVPSHYTGYAIASITRSIQNNESVIGAAFPSSHVSASLVCSLLALRYLPPFGRVLLPLAFGVAMATVYLGYHHLLDPIAGLAWGSLCYMAGIAWLQRRGEDPGQRPNGWSWPRIGPGR